MYVYKGLVQTNLRPLSTFTPSQMKVPNTDYRFCSPPHSKILLAKLRLWTEEYLRLEQTTTVIHDKGR